MLHYLERSQNTFVMVEGEEESPRLGCFEFEGGQIAGSGSRRLYSGPPKKIRRLPDSAPAAEPSAVAKVLQELAQSLPGLVTLHYSGRSAVRLTLGTTLEPELRSSAVWAVTGSILTRRRRMLPIGWSGLGQGLDFMKCRSLVKQLREATNALDQADMASPGDFPAVLAPSAAALLVHEAVGHFAEAPSNPGIDLSHRLGCRLASELLNVQDNPRADGGKTNYLLDDEGIASLGPTAVVREGILVGQLHSLGSSFVTGSATSANGRSASAWNIPVPRMSNLVCRAGDAIEDELVDHAKDGLYIHRLADGFSTGPNIEARLILAEWIKRGRRTGHFVTGGMVRERIGLLTRLVELGNESLFSDNSLCGKAGQVLFDVGTAAPAMRFTRLRIAA